MPDELHNECTALDHVCGDATSFDEWHTEVKLPADVCRQVNDQGELCREIQVL